MSEATPILRNILLDALSALPGTREFHVHVLQSSPRRNTSLFQFAKPRPRTYVQDVLVLVSEQANPDAPRVFVAAIEANLYHIPTTSSAILYVCKVDSTGQSSGKSPTPALVRAFLHYYASPATRPISARHLWIQLFARAQGQYLFPNSAQYEGKHPLNDVRLCAWWKHILSQIALDVAKASTSGSAAALSPTIVQPYYVLPGFSQLEAECSLKIASSDVAWEYGHPYQQNSSLPCPSDTQAKKNLGHYIPYFDDDPKSRFLDEIAYTTGGEVKSPVRKRARTVTSMDDTKAREGEEIDGGKWDGKEKDDRPLGELGRVTPDEFWERMSFRQECVAGAVTGFFTLIMSTKAQTQEPEGMGQPKSQQQQQHAASSPLEPQPGQISSQINKRVLTALTTGVEFSTTERAVKATETLESTIKRLCEDIPVSGTSYHPNGRTTTPEPRERSSSTLHIPPSTPPRNSRKQSLPDVTPNPFPEPVASLETYRSHIYGSVRVSNPVPEPALRSGGKGDNEQGSEGQTVPAVTVLTARKKKKRVE